MCMASSPKAPKPAYVPPAPPPAATNDQLAPLQAGAIAAKQDGPKYGMSALRQDLTIPTAPSNGLNIPL